MLQVDLYLDSILCARFVVLRKNFHSFWPSSNSSRNKRQWCSLPHAPLSATLPSSHEGQLSSYCTFSWHECLAFIVCRLVPSLHVLSLHGHMHNKRQKLFTEFTTLEKQVKRRTLLVGSECYPCPPVQWCVDVHRCDVQGGRLCWCGLGHTF